MIKLTKQHLILIAGDLLVILSFVWIGRSSHGLSITNIGAGLWTALPFILSWLVIAPWFGIYRDEVNRAWKKIAPRLLLAWAVAGPVALVLRALFLGRPVPAGIMPIFASIALAYIGLVALIWRLAYVWWGNHQSKQKQEAQGSTA